MNNKSFFHSNGPGTVGFIRIGVYFVETWRADRPCGVADITSAVRKR